MKDCHQSIKKWDQPKEQQYQPKEEEENTDMIIKIFAVIFK